MDLMEWYQEAVGDASENAVAARAGINQSTLNRQLKARRLSPELVVAVARAYGRDVLDALVVAGLITPADIRAHGVQMALEHATDREVADLVFRRLAVGSHPAFESDGLGADVVT